MRKLFILVSAMACTHGWAQSQPQVAGAAAPETALIYQSAFSPHPAPEIGSYKSALLWPEQAVKLALLKQPGLFIRTNTVGLDLIRTQAGVLKLSRSVYRAWIEAVAAQQSLTFVASTHEAAQTAAELAQRMTQVGNWSKVPLLQAQLVEAGAASQLAKAQEQAFVTRENLIKLIGISGDQTKIDLPPQLPKLPTTPLPWAELETQALRNKPEWVLAIAAAGLAQANVGTQDVLELQAAMTDAVRSLPALTAPTLATLPMTAPQLPMTRVAQNRTLENALTPMIEADTLTLATRTQTREAWYRYRTAFDVARHQQDTVVPLTTALQEETQLRYNGMLQSTWELLASARARIESMNAATLTQRDFWLAHTDLQAVLGGANIDFTAEPAQNSTGTDTPQGH